MKRTPMSFDASMKQNPKQLVMGAQTENSFDTDHDTSSRIGEDLSATLNRILQVSSTPSGSMEMLISESSQQSSEDVTMQRVTSTNDFKEGKKRKSSSKKKRKDYEEEHELLASLTTACNSMQEEEERTFARCLDSGVRSAQLTGFFFARDKEQKQFTVFRIEVITVAQTWIVFRRYSDFVNLATKLQNLSPPNFPPKTPFGGNFVKGFLSKRQSQLSTWLEKAISSPGVVTMPDVRNFLVLGANCPPSSLVEDLDEQKKSSTSSSGSGGEQGKKSIELQDQFMTPKKQTSKSSSNESSSTPSSTAAGQNNTSSSANRLQTKSPYTQNTRKVSLGDFEMLQVLGKGSFGKVVLALKRTGRDANTLYAMKILNKQNVVNKNQVEHTLTERSVLGKMNHPFIVKLHYAFQTEQKLHFVLDYCPGGELFFHLGRAGRFSEHQGRFYAAEMTLALGHLHSHGVVYRDLKPENILFEANGHLKLADFGLSKEGVESTQGSHSFCGTPEYLAPEILNRTGHGTAVDWWSLGALLYEMLTGLPPWFNQDRQKLFLGIKHAPLRFPPEVSPLSRSILSDFLKRDPLHRLGSGGVEQVKKHPFFASIDWVALYELRIPAPFLPRVHNVLDTGNFDPQFTRMPLHSEIANSPVHTMVPPSTSASAPVPPIVQQQQPAAQQAGPKKMAAASDEAALFRGFTYQEEFGFATPPTPFNTAGMCTPPPLPTNKRLSPLRPGPAMYHARPSSSGASSVTRTQNMIPASSPTVSG